MQDKEFKLTDKNFRFVVDFIYKHTGIKLADHKRDMVYGRLARRLRELKLKEFNQYCAFLESNDGKEEIGNFVNALTTNLTSFFREEHHFDHMRQELERITKDVKPGKRVRIWSAACSSGQEPYSIAMTMLESINNIAAWDAKILATDIDTNMINKSKEGIYKISEKDNIPSLMQKKYINRVNKSQNEIVMSDGIKKFITFKQLNLLDRWPMKGPFDIVFCRNVVIYFDKETQKVLFENMAKIMKMGGILYIGHSENLFNISDRFKLIGRTIYQRVN